MSDEGGIAMMDSNDHQALADAALLCASPKLYAALKMVCDSGVALAEPIERAMLEALSDADRLP